MIEYERSNWWGTVLAFRGIVLPNIMGRVGALTIFTLLLCLLNQQRVAAVMGASGKR